MKTNLKRIFALVLVLIMTVSIVPRVDLVYGANWWESTLLGALMPFAAQNDAPSGKTPGTSDHTADSDSSDDYSEKMDLRDNTRRAGRVWADKSVFEEEITLNWDTDGIGAEKDKNINNVGDKNGITITNESDFLTMFSALGSGVAQHNIMALDVVFVLDTSASMSSQGEEQFIGGPANSDGKRDESDYILKESDNEDDITRTSQGYPDADINKNPRLEHAVDSINNSIEQIMTASDYNRVALVTFNLGAATVLPLDRYDKTVVNRTKDQSGGLHNGEERYLTVAQASNKVDGGRTGTNQKHIQTDKTAVDPGPNAKYEDPNNADLSKRYLTAAASNKDDRFEQKYESNRFMDSQGTTDDWKIVEINAVSADKNKGKALDSYIGTKDDSVTGNARDHHVFFTNNGIPYLHTSAGTDTYWGIHQGMDILQNEETTTLELWKDKAGNLYETYNEIPTNLRADATKLPIQRKPVVVLITDGAPNPNSSGSFGYSKPLWNYWYADNYTVANDKNTIKNDITRYDSANGFLVAASASYEKQKVESKYNYELRMFNFGVCMDFPGDSGGTSNTALDGQVALAALHPASVFDENYEVNGFKTYGTEYFGKIRGWWNDYRTKTSVTLASEKASGGSYTLTHPAAADEISSLEYDTKFVPVDRPLDLTTELKKLISELLEPPHRAVRGENDVSGFADDSLTYVDPIGMYMEVKDVKNVLLFGTLYNVEKAELKYYKSVDPPVTEEVTDADGNKTTVTITEREVDPNSNYDYTKQFYKITSKYAYYDEGADAVTINENGAPIDDRNMTNPSYGISSNAKHEFNLDDIQIYVMDTGDYRDDSNKNVHADTGSTKQNLYIDIPTAALPMQVVTVTLDDEDEFVNYRTNVGLNDRDVERDASNKEVLTDKYYTKKQQSTPFRVIYEVGVDHDILKENGYVDLTKVDASYLTEMKEDGTGGYRDGGKIYFYSNWYNRQGADYDGYVANTVADTQYTFGDAYVSFTANYDNRYYVFEENRLMFLRPDSAKNDVLGTAVKEINGEFYTYELKYDDEGNRIEGKRSETALTKITEASQFKNGRDGNEDGNYYILVQYYDREGLVQYVLPRKGSEFGYGSDSDGVARTENDYLCWYNPKTGAVRNYKQDSNNPGNPYGLVEGFYLAAKAGSLRVGDLSAGIGIKPGVTQQGQGQSKTGTADTNYMPTISNSTRTVVTQDDDGNTIQVLRPVMNLYLGNNGRLAVNNNLLLITKQTTDIDGENRSDADDSDEKEVFNYTVEIYDPKWEAGTHAVIETVYEDKYNYDVWRALIKTVELLTGNYGFLWGNDGTRSIVYLNEDGEIVEDVNEENKENLTPYYVYVGGENGADASGEGGGTVTFYDHDNDDHDFADMLGGDTKITTQAYLIKVDSDLGREIEAGEVTIERLKEDIQKAVANDPEAKVAISMPGFKIGSVTPQDIGHAITMDYKSRVTYLTRDIYFNPIEGKDYWYSATFTLRDGEGILINGLNEYVPDEEEIPIEMRGKSIPYIVTEDLQDNQVSKGINFQKVNHVSDVLTTTEKKRNTYSNDLSRPNLSGPKDGTKEDTYYAFDNENYSYCVYGAVNRHFAEEVHYYNYVPKVEKIELEHAEEGYANIGDELTYIISWENYAIGDDGNYTPATIMIDDYLDPGVDFLYADFVEEVRDEEGKIIYDENGNITFKEIDWESKGWEVISIEDGDKISITWHDPDDVDFENYWSFDYQPKNTHHAFWQILNAPAQSHGYVRLHVKVNEDAEQDWHYKDNKFDEADAEIGKNDYKVMNKAGVYVGNNSVITTNIVETSTWAPKKKEIKASGNDLTDDDMSKADNGYLVGPQVDVGDEVTYTISYKNITNDTADITIVDKLDPGVDFVSAQWGSNRLIPGGNIDTMSVTIVYDSEKHEVTWTIYNVEPGVDGTVTLNVKVNEDAVHGWDYTEGLDSETSEDDDYKIFNRASVQIGNDSARFTDTIRNPLPSPFVEMPATGGTGTMMFIFLGAAFIGVDALLIYLRKKRYVRA